MRRTSTTSPGRRARTTSSGRERFAHPGLPPVDLRLLLQPEHAGQADRHFQAARAALRYFGEWFGAYPYPNLTIVDPAWQSGAGGMEYPTLITAGTRWLAPRGVAEPEDVVVHETGHQFWYGVVATNEIEHAWMDEGLTTYSTARALEQFFGPQSYSERYFGGFIPWVYKDLPLTRAVDGNRLAAYRAAGNRDVPATATWRYWPATAPAITYSKTALWLHTLERLLGWETVQRILQTYFARYAFKHPKPAGFLRRRQRGQRPGPDVVLRPGLPQRQHVRLQDRRVHQRHPARSRATSAKASGPAPRQPTARASSSGGKAQGRFRST